MDNSSINPVKGPDIQTTKSPPSSGKPVSTPSKAEVEVAPKDTVTLSPEAKSALERAAPETTREAEPQSPPVVTTKVVDRPKTESENLSTDNSRQLSVTDANDVVLKIVDNETREVVKQIPSEEELQLKTAIREGAENISPKNNTPDELI